MQSKSNYYWLLLLVPIGFLAWYLSAATSVKPTRVLPVYGPKNLSAEQREKHRVPDFSFLNQDSLPTDQSVVRGKIYVAEFFFTTCQSICPIMNDHMAKLYRDFGNEQRLLFLSHTVDPENDTPAALRKYAARMGVNDQRWIFLTGTKPSLYNMARNGYLLDDSKGHGDQDDFVHTQNFALVDWERKIRGFYDGTDTLEVRRLKQDMGELIKELDYNENNSR